MMIRYVMMKMSMNEAKGSLIRIESATIIYVEIMEIHLI